jgi:hypothetical protein
LDDTDVLGSRPCCRARGGDSKDILVAVIVDPLSHKIIGQRQKIEGDYSERFFWHQFILFDFQIILSAFYIYPKFIPAPALVSKSETINGR